jgi:glycerol-3-phosphate O-acyltransferase
MKVFPDKPFRLPRLRPYAPQPDDPPIFWFNDEREDIVREVARRVVAHHATDRHHMELALNEVAYQESERLARQKDEEAREHLGYWRGLLRRVARMTDEDKRRTLDEICDRMARDVAGSFDPRVYKLAENVIPRLITAVMNPSALAREIFTPHSSIGNLLQIDGPIEKLRRLAKRGTLVFVPTHSSNLDSIVLGYALQRADLPPVVYGAGKNLFTNPIVSFFMHNLGAYRVDRRVKSALYKDVLKMYSCVMIERGYHSLFFPGGTRSRSNIVEQKLKLGLAGTALEAFAQNQVRGVNRPVYFVPATINYALSLEGETLIEDHLKEKGKARYIIEDDEFSRVDRWVAFFRKLTALESACIIRFSEPIDPFGNPIDEEGGSLTPQGKTIDPGSYVRRSGVPSVDVARDMAYTQELGEVIVEAYHRDTVIMSTHLVAHVLFRRLVKATPGVDVFVRVRHRGDVSMPRDELVREVSDARDALLALERRGRVHASPLLHEESAEHIVERALAAFKGYHDRIAALDVGAEVTAEDPTLLLYYQNRVVPWAIDLADESTLAAAREIAQMGREP